MNAAAEEEDGETVSVKSFETCCVLPPEEAHVVPVVVAHRPASHADNTVDDNNPGEPAEDRSRVPGGEQNHGHVVVPAREEEGAATLIQSAFRGFMV